MNAKQRNSVQYNCAYCRSKRRCWPLSKWLANWLPCARWQYGGKGCRQERKQKG